MRSLVHAAALAGLLLPACFAGSAIAADLYPYDEPSLPPPPPAAYVSPPPPLAVLPPPQVPIVVGPRPCGIYRACPGPYARFYPRPAYAYERPAYAPIRREGYGYDYDRLRFERAHEHVSRYGYDRPPAPRYHPRQERYDHGRHEYERYGQARPYADPLGYGPPGPRRSDRYGDYDGRGDERFDRGPDPYDRG